VSDTAVNPEAVLEILRTVEDPDLHRDIVSLGFIKDLAVDGGKVAFKVELTTPACPVKEQLKEECHSKVSGIPGVTDVDVTMTAQTRSANVSGGPVLEGVKNIVAVASGKGGVGKSTTAINLALALSATGASVGLLDADVYGPSMAMMFGISGRPMVNEDKKLIPLEGYGVKVVSMGFLSDPDKPVIWRGPMVHGLIQQFARDVVWGELDYLVIDLPPGTGDAQLSVSQVVSISGAVIVTTPQDVSLIDARKGLKMFEQMKVPVLGIVENMSYFICPDCQSRHEIFRHGGGEKAANELGVAYLGEIPIDPAVVISGDEGSPIVRSNPDSPAAKAFSGLAGNVASRLSILAEQASSSQGPVMPGPIEWK
jgi:ATP-binding protein involved in chromosome partitioning